MTDVRRRRRPEDDDRLRARPAAVRRVLRARAAGERHEGHVAGARGLRGGAEAARAALYKTRGICFICWIGVRRRRHERGHVPDGGHVLPRVEHAAVPRRQRVEFKCCGARLRRQFDLARDVSPARVDGRGLYYG